MHQPLYKDLVTGEYRLPWTRFHALKDYYGMVKVLEDFPSVHQTFNLVPSMIVQIQEYASGVAADPFLDCAVKLAEDLTEAEREFVLRYFFQANAHRLIYRYPRYGELFDVFKACGADARVARQHFSAQDLRDLQVLSQVAWFDEDFQEHDAEVKGLVAKGRDYSVDDQALMARKEREILGRVVPVYKEFAARGQIEISTTPFYHPILPLVCDSSIASVSHPGVALPGRFQYPQDALDQLKRARAFMERELGRAPVGLWPSEGSVSDEALALAAEAGFQWAASDNGVLARTVHHDANPEVTYRSYLWQQNGRELRMIFRDHFLSDQVGFVYSGWRAEDAAANFLHRIRENVRPMLEHGADVLVPIILDGENAWEYYYQNGRPFLRELYRQITESSDFAALTVSEALALDTPRTIDHIHPGSWIDANFDIWIGDEEDNTAWEYLLAARRKFDELTSTVPEKQRALAYEELLIAEGSDWCWWYGPQHVSENRIEFDELYRQHLANVYHALGVPAPPELSSPILRTNIPDVNHPPVHAIHPVIDGEVTSFFEWAGAGRYRPDNRSGAMHSSEPRLRDVYYGSDAENLYLRLDADAGYPLNTLELRTGERTVPLLNNPAVQFAKQRVTEIRVPRALFNSAELGLAINGELLPARILVERRD
ncbi:MAG TPA: glycoside hydrolase family 57 protein [Bryobacteraceae bacterium]|nr:glycoside hydrolase family 57 protein [Bryobacteraceae bacterium]